jgi:hypothetical protein
MSRILAVPGIARPARVPKVHAHPGNLASCAAAGLMFTAALTAVLGMSALLSLAGVH